MTVRGQLTVVVAVLIKNFKKNSIKLKASVPKQFLFSLTMHPIDQYKNRIFAKKNQHKWNHIESENLSRSIPVLHSRIWCLIVWLNRKFYIIRLHIWSSSNFVVAGLQFVATYRLRIRIVKIVFLIEHPYSVINTSQSVSLYESVCEWHYIKILSKFSVRKFIKHERRNRYCFTWSSVICRFFFLTIFLNFSVIFSFYRWFSRLASFYRTQKLYRTQLDHC